jgi:GDP-mannose pyrophosphatase NudK
MSMDQVRIISTEVISNSHYVFKRVKFNLLINNAWCTQSREIFDRGNGAAILLFNKSSGKVILTRQFRLPTYLNGNNSGQLIEVCAGSIENESPEENIIREVIEETGYHIQNPKKVIQAYMSPGAVTEIIHFFVAEYDSAMKLGPGGGVLDENEYIQVLELSFLSALSMINNGEIRDAKTIMLLQYVALNRLME